MNIGGREFSFGEGHVYVMGILNVTPDSFSDGGKYRTVDDALRRAEEMVNQGADIIDVGGESTRPGYQKISVEEETRRVTSVIHALKKNFDIPISADSYKAPVMEAALQAGADLANDIWGLRYDSLHAPEDRDSVWECGTMAQIVAAYHVPVCLMHNRREAVYNNFLEDMLTDLQESIETGERAGIGRDQMIIDPGVGFAKNYEQNLQVLARLEEFHRLGMPLLLAASRKSVIGQTLDLPVEEREEGTIVTSVLAGIHGYSIVRVHDVQKNVRALMMLEKIQKNCRNKLTIPDKSFIM